MSRRRLAISSLLCDDEGSDDKPEPQYEEVILAPHLKRSSPQRVDTATSAQPTASPNSKFGLDALVHAASAAAAAERIPTAPWPLEDPYSRTTNPTFYPPQHLQRHQKQLEQRHVHREQILGYNEDSSRPGRKSDPLPGLRTIPSPAMPTSLSTPGIGQHSRFNEADGHLSKKRRFSDAQHDEQYARTQQYEHLRQQDDADRYRRDDEPRRQQESRSSISSLTSPSPLSRRTGYDPVHENTGPRHWDQPSYSQRTYREVIETDPETQAEDERRARNGHREPSAYPASSPYRESHSHFPTLSPNISQERPRSRSDAHAHHQYTYSRESRHVSPTSVASTKSPHFQHDVIHESENHGSHHPHPQLRDPYHVAPQHGVRDVSHPQTTHQPLVPQYRMISPVGRRSPPGSQAGRAIAAKKVEQEHQMPTMESVLSGRSAEDVRVKREPVVAVVETDKETKKKERRVSRTKEPSPSVFTLASDPELRPMVKPELSVSLPPSPPSQMPSTPRQIIPPLTIPQTQEDPHEWLLELYEDRPKVKRPNSSSSVSGAVMPSTRSDPGRHSAVSPVAEKVTKSPPVSSTLSSPVKCDVAQVDKDGDDAMMALEEELDAELAGVVTEVQQYKPDAMDVDVDQAVAELVDETLGTDAGTPALSGRQMDDEGESEVEMLHGEDVGGQDERRDDKAMDVDVEDELLSLLDDRPNSSMSTSNSNPLESKGPTAKPQATLKLKNEEAGSRPSSPITASPFWPSGAAGVRQSSAKPSEKDDRESMPPPSAPMVKPEVTATAPQPKKRAKPGPKPRPRNPDGSIVGAPPPKPRGKPGPKPKPRDEFGNIIRAPSTSATPAAVSTTSKSGRATSSSTPVPPSQVARAASGSHGPAGGSSSGARSRSTSAHPAGSVGPDGDENVKEEKAEEKAEDDKLYCLCKTKYDEDKPMIACDSCDEWYHMKCVEIPEHMGDLVDQFFCSACVAKNPNIQLKTTYKTRCLLGLDFPDPDSPKACHKPARSFSKYCSDECGVKNLRKRIDTFTQKGGKKEDLWETVKTASKREGLVRVIEPAPAMKVDVTECDPLKPIIREIKPLKSKQEREIERLNGLLADIEKVRDELRRGMDIILSREKLLQLARERGESLSQCGWDQRLCFSDDDWEAYGEGVLESYNEQDNTENNTEEAEWWCPNEQDCERHDGWQSLRFKDVDKEKEKKEEALDKLTSREREIRKRIDRIEESEVGLLLGSAPRRNAGGKGNKLTNGNSTTKTKVNGDAPKKGKKRKAPT